MDFKIYAFFVIPACIGLVDKSGENKKPDTLWVYSVKQQLNPVCEETTAILPIKSNYFSFSAGWQIEILY